MQSTLLFQSFQQYLMIIYILYIGSFGLLTLYAQIREESLSALNRAHSYIHKIKIVKILHKCGGAQTHIYAQMGVHAHIHPFSAPPRHTAQQLDGWWLSSSGSLWLELWSAAACIGSHTQPR